VLPTSGSLELSGVPIALNGTFTQSDVNGGLLIYAHSGASTGVDNFTVSIVDGAGAGAGPFAFNIAIAASPAPAPPAAMVAVSPPMVVVPVQAVAIQAPAPAQVKTVTPENAGLPTTSAPLPPTQMSGDAGNSSSSTSDAAPAATGLTGQPSAYIATDGKGRPQVDPARSQASASTVKKAEQQVSSALPQSITFDVSGIEPTFTQGPDALSLAAYHATLRNDHWVGELSRMRSTVDEQIGVEHRLVASSVAITGSLSIGYVVWLLRGGLLLSSLISSLPAWHIIDPLPVLARSRRNRDDGDAEDDPIEKLFSRAKAAIGRGRDNAAAATPAEAAEPTVTVPASDTINTQVAT
jgi:Cadherin-like